MTRSARRRWSRDLSSEVDGIAFGATGPVVLHGYDPPAGGKWFDSVIPGKVGAFDRQSGEPLWTSPCEVGYGRGFGAGLGEQGELVILGPSGSGHRIARMSMQTGEVLGVAPTAEFDSAIVEPDLCVCVSAKRVTALLTTPMAETWTFHREGQRYHLVARVGDRVFVVFSYQGKKGQGVLVLDAHTGRYGGELVEPKQPVVHAIGAANGQLALLVEDLEAILPEDLGRQMALERLLAEDPDSPESPPEEGGGGLVVLDPKAAPGGAPRWFQRLAADAVEGSMVLDSGKLYTASGALLSVRDGLTGRLLGELAVPGLDESVAWGIRQGAFLLAEETRASVFEIPD